MSQGDGPWTQLAGKVLELYWPHTVPFPAGGYPASSARTAERLLRNVEWRLIEMPLRRLQTVGTTEQAFIYRIA